MQRTRTVFRTLASTLVASLALFVAVVAHASPRQDVVAHIAATSLEGKLNVNTASAAQWILLPGIGPAIAEKIVRYRARRSFRHVSHLMRVKGIGRKTYANIRRFLTLEGETTLRQAPRLPPLGLPHASSG